jgi:acyl carrier protein
MVDNLESRIVGIAEAVLSCQINRESTMDNTPEWDSLKKIDLLLTVEEELGITFEPASIGSLTSISSLVAAATKQALNK